MIVMVRCFWRTGRAERGIVWEESHRPDGSQVKTDGNEIEKRKLF